MTHPIPVHSARAQDDRLFVRRSLLLLALFVTAILPAAAEPAADHGTPTAANAANPAELIRIFFPPAPPVLNGPRNQPASISPAAPAAPPGLAAYVDAPFYAPLSTRLAEQDMDDSLIFRLESYRSAKSALLTELHAKLVTLRDAEPVSRERTLAAFARDQTPRIAALEDAGEQLRHDLGASGSGWKEYVRWRVGIFSLPPQPPAAQPLLRRQLIDAAVYYQRGLSSAQRRLLLEQARESNAGLPGAPEGNRSDLLEFSPASARIELPPDLPAGLNQQIAAYRAEKMSLKAELDAALFGPDKDPEAAGQITALTALAEKQRPQFAALETQAEAIRHGLALLNDPFRPPELPPAVPADLAQRFATYRAQNMALQKELLDRVEAAKSAYGVEQGPKIQQAIADYTKENADRLAALNRDRDAIRSDLAKLPGNSAQTGVSPDALLTKFSHSLRDLEKAWDYRDYQTAVLQPGLSPEQRRLLFGGELEKLALPLPPATLRFGSL